MIHVFDLLKKYQIKPKQSLGQNFLIDQNILNKIVKAAELKPTDNILEVGAGLGILTEKLVEQTKKVVAVELDESLFFVLRQVFKQQKNLELVKEDILNLRFDKLKKLFNNQPYKIVANIPYNITSKFLRMFLEAEYKPQVMTLLMQKEVAQRILAKPGQMSRLSVSVQYYAEPKIIDYVSANCFYPKPEVDSALISFKIKRSRLHRGFGGQAKDQKNINKEFFRVVRIGFSAKRKQLQNNLANGLHLNREEVKKKLKKAGFTETIRAQELSVADWQKLVEALKHGNMLA